jgi:hypothetical protein
LKEILMSVSSASGPSAAVAVAAQQAVQAKKPSPPADKPNDHDADDIGQAIQAAPSPGTGAVVDKTA